MYDDKKIKRIVKKVCDEANVTTNIHPNGERAEGYSFIVTGMLYSWVIDALIKAINEAFPDADPLGTWRIQNGRLQVPCSGVKKEQYDTCPSDQQKPERPKGLCIQWVKSDMTPAAFVQLMADAGGRFLYTRMDEIGLLNQLKTNGKGNNVTEILRLAYDCGDYGQERVGTKSVCEDVQIRWNWNASTTPGKCRKFFGDAMLDGTLSRMSFCTIYTDDDRMPLYGIYDEKFQEQVQQAVAQLNDAKGLVVCRKANALAAAMIEENRQYSALADDDVYRELSYRATLSAFKRGMVLYLLNGQKWCKEIEDFVRWSYHYDMWCKMWIFGEKMRRAMDLDKAVMLPGRRNLMEFLQDTFTLDDLNTVRRAQGMKDDGSAQLRKWLSRGYCTFNPATQQYTKSAQFLEKHQKAA